MSRRAPIPAIGRMRTLIWREFVELGRDPFTILILTVLPLLLIAMLSFALTTEVRNLPVGVFDADRSEQSRMLVSAMESTGYFRIDRLSGLAGLRSRMASGRLAAAIVIPPGFSRDLTRGRSAKVQAIFDGTETVIAANAEGLIDAMIGAFDRKLQAGNPRRVAIATGLFPGAGMAPGERDPEGGNVLGTRRGGDVADPSSSGTDLSRARGTGPIRIVQRNLFNPGMRGTDFTIPGLIGFITTFLCILTTALSIVRERQAGTFEHLRVTPVRPIEIILGKILPLGFVYLIDTCLLMALGYFLFDIWPKGSVLLLLSVTALYLMLNLAWGLLVSAGSRSPDQAVQATVLIVTPQLSLSGFVFPIHSMPEWARWLVELVPFAHFLRIIRGIYLTGAGMSDIWPELLVLLGFLTLFLLAVNRSLEKIKV